MEADLSDYIELLLVLEAWSTRTIAHGAESAAQNGHGMNVATEGRLTAQSRRAYL